MLMKATGKEWTQLMKEAVLQAVGPKEGPTHDLWSPDNGIKCFSCRTWNQMIWCLSCWGLLLFWSNNSCYTPVLIIWHGNVLVIIYWKYVAFFFFVLQELLESHIRLGIWTLKQLEPSKTMKSSPLKLDWTTLLYEMTIGLQRQVVMAKGYSERVSRKGSELVNVDYQCDKI